MGAKVTFDETIKEIQVTETPDSNGEIFIDVKTDLYSDGKEDWIANENLRKFYFPIEAVGGNPLPGEKELGTTFFLASDWKIRPYNSDHRLIINGNLYSVDGSDPFLDTIGTYTVRIMQQVSSLVDSTITQLEEIEYASFNSVVTIDTGSSYSGTNYPVGTPQAPVNNLDDALLIASERGLTKLQFISDFTFGPTVNFSNMCICGTGMQGIILTFQYGSICTYCSVLNAKITGSPLGIHHIDDCLISDYGGETPVPSSAEVIIENSIIDGTLLLPSNFTGVIKSLNCTTGETEKVDAPILDINGANCKFLVREFSGTLQIKNIDDAEVDISIDVDPGNIILDSSITDGSIIIRGFGIVEDNSTGNASIDITELMNPDVITAKVWDEPTADRQTPGTIGGDYYQMLQVMPRMLGLVQENFKMDQQTYQTYNGAKLLTGARIRIYTDGALTQLLATYQITSTWSNGECTNYEMVKV